MALLRPVTLAALCLGASLAQAAGFRLLDIPAGPAGPALRGAVWTPCAAPAEKITLPPLAIEGSWDCPITGNRLPLVVISHSKGGSSLLHHDTAARLADAGFVVAAINHPGHNFQDMSGLGGLDVYATRPADMQRLVDYMLGAWPAHTALDAERVGLFGFSAGGYTGLAAIGARPDFRLWLDRCEPASTLPACQALRRNEQPVVPPRDTRIKAAVIVDPLSAFDAAGLQPVTVPVQLWASAFGGDGVAPAAVEAVHRNLPTPPEWHAVPGSAHFAFIAPCTPAMAQAMRDICSDPPGFDRAAFHVDFNAQVLRFFQRTIGPATLP